MKIVSKLDYLNRITWGWIFKSLSLQLFDSIFDVVELLIFVFEVAFNVVDGQLFSVEETFEGGCFF